MSNKPSKLTILKLVATICIMLAVVSLSFNYILFAKLIGLTGNICWLIVAYIIKEKELAFLNFFCAICYIIGFIL